MRRTPPRRRDIWKNACQKRNTGTRVSRTKRKKRRALVCSDSWTSSANQIERTRRKQIFHRERPRQNALLPRVLNDRLNHLPVWLDAIRQRVGTRDIHHPLVGLIRLRRPCNLT